MLSEITTNSNELKLLSINEVRTILGIRFETVKALLNAGKIKFIEINRRKKIPFKNLLKYINDQAVAATEDSSETGIISVEEIQNKIDTLIVSLQRRENGDTIHKKG